MRQIFLIVVFLIVALDGYSQAYEITDLNSLSDQYNFERSEMKDIDGLYGKIDGSPFLNEDFVPGNIIINDSIMVENVPLRYDIYRDRIQFLNKRDLVLEIDLSKPFKFHFDDRSFLITDYLKNDKEKRGVLQVMVDGRIRLYKKHNREFRKATRAIGYRDAQPNRFHRRDPEYFVSLNNEKPRKISDKKTLVSKMKEVNSGVEDYLKNKRLRLRKEKELIRFIQFCNP